jgi:hypothetical protein
VHHGCERIMTMDRILFGDNQFFGVNHMSEEKARAQAMRFKDTSSMIEVLDTAYEMGLRTFMCTTHDVIGDIADHVAADPVKYPDYQFYPGMPYAHKYANMVGEIGMVETLRSAAPGGMIETVIKGARSALRKDVDQLMQMLVDSEMKRFANVKTPVIFLQNVVTDLLLGLKMYDLLREFHDHVKKAHGAEAGFFSMNLPRLAAALKSAGVDTPIVCCNYNKIGFRMSGGIEAYDAVLRSGEVRIVAMSVLASGAIPAEEAIKWIGERREIESIVFGASSRGNIRQTVDLIHRYSPAATF